MAIITLIKTIRIRIFYRIILRIRIIFMVLVKKKNRKELVTMEKISLIRLAKIATMTTTTMRVNLAWLMRKWIAIRKEVPLRPLSVVSLIRPHFSTQKTTTMDSSYFLLFHNLVFSRVYLLFHHFYSFKFFCATRFSSFTDQTNSTMSSRHYGHNRNRRRIRHKLQHSQFKANSSLHSSVSSLTDSTMSLNIITVTLNMG